MSSVRNAEIEQQLKYLPNYPEWEETLKKNLDSTSNIKGWAYAVHDKDMDTNNVPKEQHIHIIVELNESVKLSTIGNYIGVPKQYVQKIKQKKKIGKRYFSDIGGAIAYLTHRNAPSKYQYSDDIVVAKKGYDWLSKRNNSEQALKDNQSLNKLVKKINKGIVTCHNITDYVDINVYIQHKKDFDLAFEYYDKTQMLKKDRNILVIYIHGESGAGKTVLAKEFCKNRNLSYCISGSSRDPVQDYKGEKVLILDDLRPDTFQFQDLLKLLDNNTSSSVSSRYNDKWLSADYIIITSILSIDTFYKNYFNRVEPIEQLKRRCKIMMEVTNKEIKTYRYEAESKKYKLYKIEPNYILAKYPKETQNISDDVLNDICNSFRVSNTKDKLKE